MKRPPLRKIVVTSENRSSFTEITNVNIRALQPQASKGATPVRPTWIPQLPVRHPSRLSGHGLAEVHRLELEDYFSPNPTFPKATVICESDRKIIHIEKGINLSAEVRSTHSLIVSKTGGGKTSRFILPVILADLKAGKSIVFSDAKGDLVGTVGSFVQEHCPGARMLCLDFTDPSVSIGWNPFQEGFDDEAAAELFEALIPQNSPRETSHFRNHEIRLACATAEALAKVVSGTVTLPMIAEVLKAGHDAIGKLGRAADQQELIFFGQQAGQSNADTSYDGLLNSMMEFLREDVATVTSNGELDFEDLAGDQQIVLALRFPEGVRRTKGVQSMFVASLLAWIVDRAGRSDEGRLPRHLSLIFDEFASALDRLPCLERSIHTLRSRNVSLTAAIQTLSQFTTIYGEEAGTILAGFNTHVFLAPVDFPDAEYASRLAGEMLVEEHITQGSAQVITGSQAAIRRVLTAHDVAVPSRHPKYGNLATFCCRGTLVFQAALAPIWNFDGYEQWDRAQGGDLPAGRLQKRPSPLKPHRPDFMQEFGVNPPPSKGGSPGLKTSAIHRRLDMLKSKLEYEHTTISARKFWIRFELDNKDKLGVVLALAEQLANRKATINEFYQVTLSSKTDNIQANLHFLDYYRMSKQSQESKKPRLRIVTGEAPASRKESEPSTDEYDPFGDE